MSLISKEEALLELEPYFLCCEKLYMLHGTLGLRVQ
jgi:hypothetical protein